MIIGRTSNRFKNVDGTPLSFVRAEWLCCEWCRGQKVNRFNCRRAENASEWFGMIRVDMRAEEIMPEDCAGWIEICTMTYGIPPREGAFVKFAQLIADAAAKGGRVPTRDELCEYFKGLHWHDESACSWYADAYAWLVRAFLYQKGIFDLCPFTMERYE